MMLEKNSKIIPANVETFDNERERERESKRHRSKVQFVFSSIAAADSLSPIHW